MKQITTPRKTKSHETTLKLIDPIELTALRYSTLLSPTSVGSISIRSQYPGADLYVFVTNTKFSAPPDVLQIDIESGLETFGLSIWTILWLLQIHVFHGTVWWVATRVQSVLIRLLWRILCNVVTRMKVLWREINTTCNCCCEGIFPSTKDCKTASTAVGQIGHVKKRLF